MSPTKPLTLSVLMAVGMTAACHPPSAEANDDEQMARAMRKVEADQAKSDKLVMQRADAETQKAVRIQRAIRER